MREYLVERENTMNNSIRRLFLAMILGVMAFLTTPLLSQDAPMEEPSPVPEASEPPPPPQEESVGPPPPAPSDAGPAPEPAPSKGFTMPKRDGGPSIKGKSSSPSAVEDAPTGAVNVPAGQELVNMDFPEMTDIQDIIKAVAVWTGKNVILDRNVTGKVQIISPKRVTKEEAYQAFLSALNLLDLTTVETGKVIKIMKLRNAVRDNVKTYFGSNWSPQTDAVITQIIPLKYIDAKQLQATLTRIVNSNSVIAYEPSNTLIVSDSGFKIKRILDIIELLDVQTEQPRVLIIPMKYSDAKSVVEKVNQILQTSGGGTAAAGKSGLRAFKILTDERTNSAIIFGPPRTIVDVKDLIKKFDIPLDDPAAQASIHVRPLDYANAKLLAGTLSSLAAGGKSAAGRRPPTVPGGTGGASTEASVADLGNDVKITADEATNSLLITGSKQGYNSLNTIVRKLDIRRPQVYIEADIMDLSEDGKFEAGTSVFAGVAKSDGTGSKTIIGWQGNQGMGSLVGALATLPGTTPSAQNLQGVSDAFSKDLSIGILAGQKVHLPGIGDVTPGALIHLMKTDSNSRSVSSPNVLTSNNQEASITVGQKYLYKSTNTTAAGGTSQKIEKEDVDTTLTIKPTISYSDYVTLDFSIEANNFAGFVDGVPQTSKRKTKQVVTVKNNQTVVISGLVQTKQTETFQKIPLLGDIPVLGWLFRNSQTTSSRTNLVIFLTPHIVHGANDLAAIYKQKLKERDEYFAEIFGKRYNQDDFYKKLPTPENGEFRPTKGDEAEQKRLDQLNEELIKVMDGGAKEQADTDAEENLQKKEESVKAPVGTAPTANNAAGGGDFSTHAAPSPLVPVPTEEIAPEPLPAGEPVPETPREEP